MNEFYVKRVSEKTCTVCKLDRWPVRQIRARDYATGRDDRVVLTLDHPCYEDLRRRMNEEAER